MYTARNFCIEKRRISNIDGSLEHQDIYSIMKKDKKKGIKTFSIKSLSSEMILKKKFLIKTNYLRDLLKKNWENFLLTYQFTAEKGSLATLKSTKFFYSKKEKNFQINYLVLAKLVDFLGNNQKVKNKLRTFIKTYLKYSEVQKVFGIDVFQKSIFSSWIADLWIHKIYNFIKITNSFLYKSNVLLFLKSILKKELKNSLHYLGQNNESFLFFKSKDFFILKWYQNRIDAWLYKVLNKGQETNLVHQFNKFVSTISTNNFFAKLDNLSHCRQDNEDSCVLKNIQIQKTFITHQKREKKDFYNRKTQIRAKELKMVKQKYLLVIKNILQKSKIATQATVIKRLNRILKNWDTFLINNITQTKSLYFNLPFSQLFLRWGLARHRNQKAKCIKKRYWSFQ